MPSTHRNRRPRPNTILPVNEQFCDVGRGITLCYETFGDPSHPPLLLIMGLATQMIAWPDHFCRDLAGHGFYVVRFDNRDIGRSTHMDFRAPTTSQLLTRRFLPEQYDLGDMAEDTHNLIRELGIAPVHVVGASMGGMIAQTVVARHPEDARSLTSIMSTTGSQRVGRPHPAVYRSFIAKRPEEREAAIESAVKFFSFVGSPPPAQDLEFIRTSISAALDRDTDRFGGIRQLGAILKSGNRTKEVRTITAPTLVIHGDSDRLVNRSGGVATARAIAGSKLLEIEGMGHDLPAVFHRRIIDAIAEHAHAADEARAKSPA
jgi:pimeloyl-ACP methyl ester carboxylesterase